MSEYLRYMNRNILFMLLSAGMWILLLLLTGDRGSVLGVYAGIFVALSTLYILHYLRYDRFVAYSFVVVSDIALIMLDDGLSNSPMSGVEFLYIANILYAYTFLMGKRDLPYYFTLISTGVIFVLVNCTPITPRMISMIYVYVPSNIRALIFGITAIFFIFRLVIFLRASVTLFWEKKQERMESEIFFAHIDEAICMVDARLKMCRYNVEFQKVFRKHYGRDPQIGEFFLQSRFKGADPTVPDQALGRAQTGEILKEEYTCTSGEQKAIFEVSYFPMANSAGAVERIGIIYRDITARKKHEAEMLYSQTGLMEIIAHDLKAPLAMIKGINALPSNTENKDFIDKTCIGALESINNILKFSEYISRSDTSAFTNLDLSKVLRDKLEEMRPHAQLRDQRLLLKMCPDRLMVKMNDEAFGRALKNLLTNSIKYSKGPGDITVSADRDPENANLVCIKVSDQGLGMSDDMRSQLFEKFSTSGRVGLNGEVSHGLGLYITNAIARIHGGTLELDLNQKQGTAFVIRLPLTRYTHGQLQTQPVSGVSARPH